MPRTAHFRRVLLVSISVAALAACSGSSGSETKTAAPMPPISEMDTAMNSPAPQQLELSGSDTLTPVMPRATAATDAAMEERLARLEQSVLEMQGNYEKLGPAFASLNTTNARIQALLNEIEKEKGKKIAVAEAPAPVALAPSTTTTVTTTKTPAMKTETVKVEETIPPTGIVMPAGSVSKANAEPVKTVTNTTTTVTTPAAAPPLSSFKEQPSAEEARAEAERQTAAKAAPAAGNANSVTGVRIGEHGNKTRLVFDLNSNSKPSFKYDLDNAEKILLVEMPSAGWSGRASGKPQSPLIESWNATEEASGGSSVAIQLKKDARVISTEFLKAEGKDPARLVVDIAPQG